MHQSLPPGTLDQAVREGRHNLDHSRRMHSAGCGLGSGSAELLQTIRAVGTEGISVPWMVLEELAAQQAVKYWQKYEAAVQAIEALDQNTPWKVPTVLGDYDPERVRKHCARSTATSST